MTHVAHSSGPQTVRVRREPPRFRPVTVRRVEGVSPRMVRVTFAGPELAGLVVEQPASSVRLVVPWPDEQLVIPDWTGNEFVLPDGRRPALVARSAICRWVSAAALASPWP